MANLSVDPAEEAIILLGIALLERQLPMSNYDPLIQAKIRHAIMKLGDKITRPPTQPEYDAYGNRY